MNSNEIKLLKGILLGTFGIKIAEAIAQFFTGSSPFLMYSLPLAAYALLTSFLVVAAFAIMFWLGLNQFNKLPKWLAIFAPTSVYILKEASNVVRGLLPTISNQDILFSLVVGIPIGIVAYWYATRK